jgi:hypothetical protein
MITLICSAAAAAAAAAAHLGFVRNKNELRDLLAGDNGIDHGDHLTPHTSR